MRRLIIATVLVLAAACDRGPAGPFTPASPSPVPVPLADFSGYWSGTFNYTSCGGQRHCDLVPGRKDPFSLRLRQSGGRVTGVFSAAERVVDVSGDVQADGSVALTGSSATGGSKGIAAEYRFNAPALRLDPVFGLNGAVSFDTQTVGSSFEPATNAYAATIVSADRGNLDAFVSDLSGTWKGRFLVKGCSAAGIPICSPFDLDEVETLNLNLSIAGDAVTGELTQVSLKVPLSGRVRGRTLELEGFRPAAPGTMALRVTSFSATPDPFGRLTGTISYVAESSFRTTAYQFELVQVVKTP
jgi:hypothetical protein